MKAELLDKELSIIIKNSSFLREKSDYDDFFVASRTEAEQQLKGAEKFLKAAEEYLNTK